MVTKHNRTHWPFEPQVLTDDEAENAYIRLLEQEDEPPTNGALRWILYGVFALLALAAGVHFVAEWAQLAPL